MNKSKQHNNGNPIQLNNLSLGDSQPNQDQSTKTHVLQ